MGWFNHLEIFEDLCLKRGEKKSRYHLATEYSDTMTNLLATFFGPSNWWFVDASPDAKGCIFRFQPLVFGGVPEKMIS